MEVISQKIQRENFNTILACLPMDGVGDDGLRAFEVAKCLEFGFSTEFATEILWRLTHYGLARAIQPCGTLGFHQPTWTALVVNADDCNPTYDYSLLNDAFMEDHWGFSLPKYVINRKIECGQAYRTKRAHLKKWRQQRRRHPIPAPVSPRLSHYQRIRT